MGCMWNVEYKYYHSTAFKIIYEVVSIKHWVYHVLLKFQYLSLGLDIWLGTVSI
jgi:hypothetical protein